MKKIGNLVKGISVALLVAFTASCDDDDAKSVVTPAPVTAAVVSEFAVNLNTQNEIPTVVGRSETGVANFSLLADNTLNFSIEISNLSVSDNLVAAHIHAGDVVSTGDVVIGLVTPDSGVSFDGNTATGSVQLTTEQASLLNTADLYINVHSMQVAPGLLRGQVNQNIDAAYNVALSTANEVPAVENRTEAGEAFLRVVGNKLYYRVGVEGLAASDNITMGHLHQAAAGQNGGVFVNLEITSNAELNITKALDLTSEQLQTLNNLPSYVNIHSEQVASGLVRGQVK